MTALGFASRPTVERVPQAARAWHPLWHWLLFCTPAPALMLSWFLFGAMANAAFPIDADGPLTGGSPTTRTLLERAASDYYFISQFLLFMLLCFGLGSWWRWRESDWGERIAFGFFIGLVIALFNVAILWFACTAPDRASFSGL